jgi:imidazoleglycerol phosphate synthase cyclase subunit
MMRIIPRLDIKSENVVKGVCFEGLRVIGNPSELVEKYCRQGADEILYIDTVASLYGRKNIKHILRNAVSKLHIPLTVGGGITSLEDIEELLVSGADKVALNTFILSNPSFIREAVNEFGSQSVVVSINAKLMEDRKWVPWTDNAREPFEIDVFDWIKTALGLGAGEILLTSIDFDGRSSGLAYDLLESASEIIDVPFIVGGGFASKSDADFLTQLNIDGLATGSFLHYNRGSISDIKSWVDLGCESLGNITFTEPVPNKKFGSTRKKVGVLDYGCGNIFSLCQSLGAVGVDVKILSKAADLKMVDAMILPGVGAFGHAVRVLNDRGLVEPLMDFANSGRPILGICLGAQLLLESSEEFGLFDGLGLIPGSVRLIENKSVSCKVPNVGWRRLLSQENV